LALALWKFIGGFVFWILVILGVVALFFLPSIKAFLPGGRN